MTYLKRIRPRRPTQSQPLRNSGQVPNSAGGFAWALDNSTRLRRFLVLGSEGGSYYAAEQALTRETAKAVEDSLAADGESTVAEIVRVSEEGRAPKNDPALFALAMAASLGFMLPVSTPPNAIVYGTGNLNLRHMIAAGSLLPR